MSGHRNFNILRADLARRLDAHPDAQAIRDRIASNLDREIAEYERTLRSPELDPPPTRLPRGAAEAS